ncbi:MAG: RidA family protein [Anaerolineales bacterium]|nr:RidA family protein [Anaerolineales bacterium]
MPLEVVTTNRIPKSPNPFSLGIKAGGFLFVSGQVGKDANGKVLAGLPEQTRQTLENLKIVIEAGGGSLSQVVKATIYMTDITRLPEVNEIYRTYFTGTLPARVTVEVRKLGGTAEIEIDAIVALD